MVSEMLQQAVRAFDGPDYRNGKELESDWFPDCNPAVTVERTKYVPYRKAMEMVKSNLPGGWDPTEPATVMARDFHYLVAEEMGLTEDDVPEEEFQKLKLYPSVGTAFDVFHGVDAFFEYNGISATVALTHQEQKDEYKADVIINPEDVFSYESAVKAVAGILRGNASRSVA